ncbi:hypothetical protein [Haloferax sp. KTX1]|uniref:hypothetical protein n=1 Tax=Haloferax sp. KTX1 TaxID=2600597 RepID=UPI0011DD8B63|nr:hypothetical protein [Haloferax sp. KTX1]
MAAGSALVVAGSSSASATPDGDYTGHSYDTLTHKSAGRVSGNIVQDGTDLRGELKIAGFNIPLKELQMTENSHPADDYYGVLTDPKYEKDETPLRVTLTKLYDQFNGMISRPGGKFGHLGFNLYADDGHRDPDLAQEKHVMRPHWTNSQHDFTIPKRGLPTDTGLKRLTKLADNSPLYSIKGDGQ